MKIVMDARFWGIENTGPGRYTMSLVRALEKQDKTNEYFLLLRKKYFDDQSVKFSPNFHKVLAEVPHYSVREQITIPRLIDGVRPDITHFLHFNVPLKKTSKRVVTIHDLLMHKRTGSQATTLPWYLYLVKRFGYKKVFKNAVKSADKIIVPSNYVRDEISYYYHISKDKITATYEGVDSKVINAKAKSASPNKGEYFLYVGNAYPHKNLPRAIEAIKSLNEKNTQNKSVKLVIVSGRGVFQERIKAWAKGIGASKYIKIHNFVTDDELSRLYRNSIAFIYPSLEEGFGLPGIEAMANNTLLCASDIKVFREIYGKNALYFNPYDFTSIARVMKDVVHMKNAVKRARVKKAQSYAKRYTWDETAKETLKVYEDCFSLR